MNLPKRKVNRVLNSCTFKRLPRNIFSLFIFLLTNVFMCFVPTGKKLKSKEPRGKDN